MKHCIPEIVSSTINFNTMVAASNLTERPLVIYAAYIHVLSDIPFQEQ